MAGMDDRKKVSRLDVPDDGLNTFIDDAHLGFRFQPMLHSCDSPPIYSSRTITPDADELSAYRNFKEQFDTPTSEPPYEPSYMQHCFYYVHSIQV